jgi:DMSO/TMAO reductase YedYZ molybdopterin-dependent catalytic subunit
MRAHQRPGLVDGLFVAGMATAALIGVFFFGWKVAGLPFVPFDFFDWLTRMLPGRVIAFGIGTMVTVIRGLNLGPTSETAKLAEQGMAVVGLFISGVVGCAFLFAMIRATRGRHGRDLGLGLGMLLGIAALLVDLHGSPASSFSPAVRAAWVLGMFLLWGLFLGWAAQRLAGFAGAGYNVAAGKPVVHSDPAVEVIDRRRFLVRLAGGTAAVTVTGAVIGELAEKRRQEAMSIAAGGGRWSATHPLPNLAATVIPAPGTRLEFTPLEQHYRIDINTVSPAIDQQQWRLKIRGLVEQPLALSIEQLRRHEPLHQFITLSCISNPVGGDLIGTTRWTGVSLQRLLPDFRLKTGATHLKIRAADQFFETISLADILGDERIMLTYAWDGLPLTRDHGFPLRVYIPDVHGMKQPKWIESIEAMDHWEPGYWVQRGWDKVARMHATAVIDTVAVDMSIIGADSRKLVPIGGIAHAGARPISKVEVRVDDGPWQPAALRTPLSPLTWVVWRYEWPFQPGKHTFAVRCYEADGTAQIEAFTPAEPSGATGLHAKTMMF